MQRKRQRQKGREEEVSETTELLELRKIQQKRDGLDSIQERFKRTTSLPLAYLPYDPKTEILTRTHDGKWVYAQK